MTLKEMESKASEIKNLQALIDEATAEMDGLKDEIKKAMGEAETVQAGAFKISWKNVTSTRLDSKSLKKDLPELAARYSVTSTSKRFTIS